MATKMNSKSVDREDFKSEGLRTDVFFMNKTKENTHTHTHKTKKKKTPAIRDRNANSKSEVFSIAFYFGILKLLAQ